jgi:hypothetical protein
MTIVLPPNIAITTKRQVSIAKAGATPIELAWQREGERITRLVKKEVREHLK